MTLNEVSEQYDDAACGAGDQDAFLESMAEAGKSVVEALDQACVDLVYAAEDGRSLSTVWSSGTACIPSATLTAGWM